MRVRSCIVGVLVVIIASAGARACEPPGPTPRESVLPRSAGPRGPRPAWAGESWFIRRQVEPPWVLRDVNVIDVLTGEVRVGVNVTVRADLIEEIGSGPPPADAEVVDGGGGWVIPGLFDLHAHVIPRSRLFPAATSPEETLAALLDAGVTTIRALPLYSESALAWASEINRGVTPGPTVVGASSVLEKEPQRTTSGFGDPRTAAAWVRKETLLGARWIKVYNHMDEASLAAIVAAAAEHGARACGHANEVPPHRAAALGMATIEHAVSIAHSAVRDDAPPMPRGASLRQAAWCWEHVDRAKLDALMATFRRHGTGWVPTLVVLEAVVEGAAHDQHPMPPDVIAAFRTALDESARLAVRQHRAGGLVGLGTDFPVDGVVAGASARRELELLVERGGATPLEALQIGTIGSARILGFEALVGTVGPGQLAHFVVLDDNPLERIGAVGGVRFVVHDGRLREPGAQP